MLGLKARMAIIDNSGGLIAECVNVLRNKTTQGLGRVGKLSTSLRYWPGHFKSRLLTLTTGFHSHN